MSTDTLLVADAETIEFRQGGPAIGGIWLVSRRLSAKWDGGLIRLLDPTFGECPC